MENPGKIELKRILNCMKDYEYNNSLEEGEFDGCYKFNLIKRLDDSSDDTIKVTIDFPTVIDDDKPNYKKDTTNENFIYNRENSAKAGKFINKLMKDVSVSTKRGGQKKKQRKTKKNKKK